MGNDSKDTAWYLPDDAELIWRKMIFYPLVTKITHMKVPEFAQQFLTEDAQTLIKAGFLDPSHGLNLTPKGNSFLDSLLFTANKDAMLKEAQSRVAAEVVKNNNNVGETATT